MSGNCTSNCSSACLLIGRFLLAPIFILSGTIKILHWSETAGQMTSKGLPAVPVLLGLAIAIELAGGLAVLLGWQARLGALLLALFLVPVTLTFHDFWRYEGAAQTNQMQHFMKNGTIMGGLLTLVGAGAGRFALDACGRSCARRSRAAEGTADLTTRNAYLDEVGDESFPASDPPARTPVSGVGPLT